MSSKNDKTQLISSIPLNTSGSFKFESYANPSENSLSKIPEVNTPVLGIFSGIFAEASISRNNRYYSRDFWNKVISSELVQEYLKSGKMIGIFEHPEIDEIYDDQGHPTATHPYNGAFITKGLQLKGDQLWGEAYVLNTPMGRLLATYFLAKDKYQKPLVQLYVSARGKTVNTNIGPDGIERMDPDDYILPAFDVVLDPGFVNAKVEMTAVNESRNKSKLDSSRFNDNYESYNKLESAVHDVKDFLVCRKNIIKELNLKSIR